MMRAILLGIALIGLAACVPEQQKLIVTPDPAEISENKAVTSKAQLPETTQQNSAPETTSLPRVTVLPDPPKPQEETVDTTQLQRVTVLPDPPKPAPIVPLNPYQFNGRPLSEIAARLGIADRQFSEQGMMIQHYYMPMCHMLLIVDETGTGPVILHIDVRPSKLGSLLEEEVCFTQIGARADAFHDSGR